MSISNVAAEKKTIAKTSTPVSGVSKDPGPASAPMPANSQLASKSDLVAAPRPASSVGILTLVQTKALLLQIGFSETKNKYEVVDVNNHCGKYQFTGQNLVDLGYIKEDYLAEYGQGSSTGVVHIAGSWTGKNNVSNLGDFLMAESLQDAAMLRLLTQYYESMSKLNAIKPNDTVSTIAGMLCVAHAIGPTAAKKWRDTGVGEDLYKVPAGIYFSIGQYAVDVLGVPTKTR